jgi:PAS domain-containing protein
MTFCSLMSRAILTRSKRFEAARRTSEERLQFAMRGSNDGFWDWDIAAGRMYYSPQLKKPLGFPEGEIRKPSLNSLPTSRPLPGWRKRPLNLR